MPETKAKKKPGSNLTLKQKRFVHNLVDPNSPTFSNQTQSYSEAYRRPVDDKNKYHAVAVDASINMTKPKIQSYIEQVMEDLGVGVKDRVQKLRDISNLEYTKTTIFKRNGKITGEKEESPSPTEAIRAIDTLNKMDGTYEKRRIEGELAKGEYELQRKELLKQMRKDMRKSPKTSNTQK